MEEKAEIYSNRQQRLAVGSVMLLCFLCYGHTLFNGFVNFDDVNERILNNPFLQTPWQWDFIPKAFSQATAGYYDPIYVLSYVIDYKLWGMNPAGFHFGNLVLHVLNSVLVYYLLLALTRDWKTAWLAALIFAVHPVHVESVSWATSRKDTLSLFFGLASFLVYWRWKAASSLKFFAAVSGSVVLLLLGMMTKPTVVCFPAMIFFADVLFGPRPHPWKRIFGFQSLANGAAGGLVLLTINMTVGFGIHPQESMTAVQHFNLFFELYAYFIKIILFPINLCARYVIQPNGELFSLTLFLIVPGLLVLTLWWIYEFRRFWFQPERFQSLAPVLWGAVVFFLGILPHTNFLPRHIYVAERYEYIASIGFCLALSHLIMRVPRETVKRVAVVLLVLLYGVLTVYRVPVWKDSVTLWADALKKMDVREETRHIIMAKAYLFQEQYAEAAEEYEKGEVHKQKNPEQLIRLAKINIQAYRFAAARNILKNLEERCPEFLLPISMRISLDIAAQKYDVVEQSLKKYQNQFIAEELTLYRDIIQAQQADDTKRLVQLFYELNGSIERRLEIERARQVELCRKQL